MHTHLVLLATILLPLELLNAQDTTARHVEWSAYGRDASGTRFAPIGDITPQNVTRLRLAWTYHTGETGSPGDPRTSFEATPLMVDSTLYLSTPRGRVIALDPATGLERWSFDAKVDPHLHFGDFTTRGVSYWVDDRAPLGAGCSRRIILATIDARLLALDAVHGHPCRGFGTDGMVDLRQGLRNAPAYTEEYEVTSPPAIVRGLIVVGSAVADNNRAQGPSGEVRAFDARTGALQWSWDAVPQDSTDPAYRTWTGPRAHDTGAANVWSVIVSDSARDLVFLPTTSPSVDYFGGTRLGDNRHANSVVALRASTGKLVWSFQTVHHDLWDYDNASPPALVTITYGGRQRAAVLQATKTGQLFVLDRVTGVPIFPVAERPVPPSTVPGEVASSTQPFTTLTPPLSPHGFTADDAWGPTPGDRAACRAVMAGLRNDGVFTPPSLEGTLVVPSNIGGAHWGGVAVDPEREIAIIPVNHLAAIVQLIPRDSLKHAEMADQRNRFGFEYTDMKGTPYYMRRRIILSERRLPCTPPPFGSLVAINLRTGTRLWDVPLGTFPLPDGTLGPAEWGSPTLGGPMATAGGVIFIAGTIDRMIRAFDTETGRELWRAPLPAGGKATPMTYRIGGKQYVVIAAGGDGDFFGKSDAVMAFRLDDEAHQVE
ncbi:MAG: pyrroloquinoline quinone-dependent dehydrogenase [Gemmatimonadota bacterium]